MSSSVNPPRLPDPEDADAKDIFIMAMALFGLIVFLLFLRLLFVIFLDVFCLRNSVDQPWQIYLKKVFPCLERGQVNRQNVDEEIEDGLEMVDNDNENENSKQLARQLMSVSLEKRRTLLDKVIPTKVITDEMVYQWNNESAGKDEERIKAPATSTQEEEECRNINGTCAICISPYEVGELCVFTRNCSHVFHKECIDQWLQKNADCPYCRTTLVSMDEIRQVTTEKVTSI